MIKQFLLSNQSLNNKIFNLGFCIVISTLFFCLFAVLFPLRFETNDDVSMLLLSSGVYTGKNETFLIFMNILYGTILKYLYSAISSVQWYSIILSLFHIISIGVFLNAIIDLTRKKIELYIFIFFLFSLSFYLLLNFQFTTTAGISCTAGLILTFRNNLANILLGILLIVFSALIRFKVTGLIFIISSAAFLVNFNFDKIGENFKNKTYMAIIFALAIVLGLFIIHNLYLKSDPRIEKNMENLRVFPRLMDNNNIYWIKKNPDSYRTIITDDEFKFYTSFIYDISKFTKEKANGIVKMMKEIPFYKKFYMSIMSLYHHFLIYFLLILNLGLLLYFELKIKLLKYLWLLFIITSLFLPIYVSIDFIYKFRVLLSGILPLIFAALYLFYKTELKNKINIENIWGKALLVMFVGLIFMNAFISNWIFIFQIAFLGLLIYLFSLKKSLIEFIFLGCIIILSLNLMARSIDSFGRNIKRIEILNSQIVLLEKYKNKSQKNVIAYKADLKTEGLNIYSINQAQKLSGVVITGWMLWHPFKTKTFDSFHDFEDKYDLLLLKDDETGIVKLIQKYYFDTYGKRLEAFTVIEDKYSKIISFNPQIITN